MPDALRLLCAAFAVYRLAQLVAYDGGPFHICARFRAAIGRRAAGGFWFWRDLGELVNCPFCLGVYFALFATILVYLPTLPGDVFLVVLALAGAQTWLECRKRED